MTIYIPGAMFAAGVSLYLFHEYNRARQAKQDERRESLNDSRQQYLQKLIESNKKKQETADEQPIKVPQDGESESDESSSL